MRRSGGLSMLVIALAACVPQLATAAETNAVSVAPTTIDAPSVVVTLAPVAMVQVADLSIRLDSVAPAPGRDSIAVTPVIESRTPAPSSVLASPDSAIERSAALHRQSVKRNRGRVLQSKTTRHRSHAAPATKRARSPAAART